jgi:hypothetical protein
VKQLEQNSFQRTIDGRPWLVHEIRYAIFPEKSGVLEIPAQTFTARESTGRRSMMGFGSSGRQLKRSTDTLSLKVLPRPDSFPGSTWLPARKVEIQETWSTPPDQLRTGESATRTIVILGEGLQGAQLPPTLFPATQGLKYYPDQPIIGESESSSGLTGSRKDSAALIPTTEGSWKIPEVRIPWWDTRAEKVRYAVLPGREVIVSAGTNIQLDSSPIAIVGPTNTAAPAPVPAAAADTGIWKAIAIISALGWLCTLLYLLLARKKAPIPQKAQAENLTEKKAFKQLVAACSVDNAAFARKGVIEWAEAMFPDKSLHSLERVAAFFNKQELSENLVDLDKRLYGDEEAHWSSGELGKIVQRLRKEQREAANTAKQPLALYPTT